MHPISSNAFGQTGVLCLFSNSSTLLSGWVKKQLSTSRYIVTDGTVTKVCTLAHTTSDAISLPDGSCAFLVSPFDAADQYVDYLTATRCSTTTDNGFAWHRRGQPSATSARILNNIQYYNIEQGLIHASPISGIVQAASFTLPQAGKIRVRLAMVYGSGSPGAQFTMKLLGTVSTSPDFANILATQVFDDTVLGDSTSPPVILEFTNASTVSLIPGRYWISLEDGPATTTAAAWFWETNLVDATVKNELNYYSDPVPSVWRNIDNATGLQMCIEVL